jgi:2-methylcitrate dehydratase PrpD
MMRRVRLKVDHEIEDEGWDRAARVTVALADKRRLSALVVHFKGTPGNPMKQSEVEDKARKLTHSLLPARKLDRVIEAVNRLEKLPDVSVLGALLRRTQ